MSDQTLQGQLRAAAMDTRPNWATELRRVADELEAAWRAPLTAEALQRVNGLYARASLILRNTPPPLQPPTMQDRLAA